MTVGRLYKDGEEWKTSDCFGRDDLPLLAKTVDLAHAWIFAKTQDGITKMPGEEADDRKPHRNGRSRQPA